MESQPRAKVDILFVCMGNICRSPTAEGVFRKLAASENHLPDLNIDSCGTIGYHVGEPPDPRTVEAALKRGYDLRNIRSRMLQENDLDTFDLILVMDKQNLANVNSLVKDKSQKDKIKLFLDYGKNTKIKEVPDPYYGCEKGFDTVIDLIEFASKGLIKTLSSKPV